MFGKIEVRALALIAAAAAAFLPAASSAKDYELPPYTRAYEPQTVDERGMWMQADEYERGLKNSPLLIKDEKLQGHIRSVLCRTVGSDRCDSARIYIMEVPAFNATMHPNGVLTVWTGLLLRVRNEAELGAILGHEFAHFELRHSLRGFKNKRNTTDLLAWTQVLGGLANTYTGDAQISLLGTMFRYGREQEEEADRLGLRYLASSEYPSSEAANVWHNLMAEADATAAGRKLKKKHRYSAGFFDTHPTELKRATYLSEAAMKYADPGESYAQRHHQAIEEIMPRLLAAQVKLNDFGGSDYLLNEIARRSEWTPSLLFARGEMYQLRGNPRDFVTASQFYREAIEKGYRAPEVHRNLGITLLKSGFSAEAKGSFQQYLSLNPGALDAGMINMLLSN